MPDNEPIIPKYMNLYKRIEYNGHHIDIYYDESPESPRAWDNLGTFYTIHHRYCPEEEFDRHFQWEEVFDRYGDFSDSFEKQYIALKIYLYDHSGQTISSSPFFYPWDSGLFGIVAVSVEKVKKEYEWKLLTADRRRTIEGYLQGEIATYDNYLRGEVYGYRITPADDKDDVLESCWGYFGDSGLEQLEDECRAIIDSLIDEQKEQEYKERLRIFGPELAFPELALN